MTETSVELLTQCCGVGEWTLLHSCQIVQITYKIAIILKKTSLSKFRKILKGKIKKYTDQ